MKLAGRLPELRACREALSGQHGRAMAAIITGPPGIGKTSVWRAAANGPPGGGVVLRTTGVPGSRAALADIADLLDPVAETEVPALPDPLAHALRAALGQESPKGPVTDALLERAIVRLLRGLTATGLVIAIDDEQWLDADSRRLLEIAAIRLADVPVRWLVSVRSDGPDRGGLARGLDHELGADAVRVDLAGLDDAAISELILSRFPGQWSAGVLRKVITLAAGNPYAALEVSRETVAKGEQDGTVAHVPPSMADAVRGHLERLGPQALAVVQAAALIATPNRALLRAVTGFAVDEHVDMALEAGILQEAPPGVALWFSHPLLQETADGMLSSPRRRELHRSIGSALDDPHEAAWHLACGAEQPDESLARRLDQAIDDAAVRGAPARATMLARAAIELTPDQNSFDGWRRRLRWLASLTLADEYGQVRRHGERWMADVPASLRGRLAVLRSRAESDREDHYKILMSAVEDLAGHDPLHAALAYAEAALVCGGMLVRLDQGRRLAKAAIPHAEAAGHPLLLRGVMGVNGLLAGLAGEAEAGDQLRAAVRMPGFEDSPRPYETPETALATWHLWRGEHGPARELMQAVMALAERNDVGKSVFDTKILLAEIERLAGNWDAAAAHAEAAARWHREGGAGGEGPLLHALAFVKADRGDVTEARALAERGLHAAEIQHDWSYVALCRGLLGHIELSVDDPAAAVRWLDPIADFWQVSGFGEPGSYSFTPDLIEAWAATGRLDDAAERLKWLQEAARRLDHPWARVTGQRAEAVLCMARRDPAGALDAVTSAVSEARSLQLPLELGRCLLVLGTAQRKTRRRREAAVSLDEAVATFRSLGAARWQDLAAAQRAQLATSPSARPGDALTPAEQRIAELVASGHSNLEIAAVMYVSVKTVESNLTRIYRKLSLRGRVDLARHDFTDRLT